MLTSARRHCILTIAVFALAACNRKPPEHGMLVDPPQPAAALRLMDVMGRPFDLAGRHHQLTFVYFGYTHCPDACPTTMTDWARAKALLGSKGELVHVVFVSVDPDRDTKQIAQSYAWQFDSTFIGLAPSAAELDSIKTAWGFAVEREEMQGMKSADYGVGHPAGVFFVDGDNKLRFVFAPGSKPAEIASDLKRLM